ncbi:MAG: hypothetical protein QXL94_02860 [Candidatus Parvarchaeum sp.]
MSDIFKLIDLFKTLANILKDIKASNDFPALLTNLKNIIEIIHELFTAIKDVEPVTMNLFNKIMDSPQLKTIVAEIEKDL